MPETLLDVILALYESEINSGLQSFYDGGIDVWIGDDLNDYKAFREFHRDEIEDAAAWLTEEACKHFPASAYAKRQAQFAQGTANE